MKSWPRIIMTALACLLISMAAILWWRTPEPTYQDKPLSYWVEQVRQAGLDDPVEFNKACIPLEGAIRSAGCKSIRMVLQQIRRQDSVWAKLYRAVWPRMPTRFQIRAHPPEPMDYETIERIGFSLGTLGPAALPSLVPALKARSSGVRLASIVAVSVIEPKPDTAVLLIAKLLKDPNGLTRRTAAIALGEMGTKAVPAIPRLIDALKDTDVGPPPRSAAIRIRLVSPTNVFNSKVAVRGSAAAALGNIGPAARAAVPDLTNLLSDSDPYVREQAAFALWRIAGVTNGVAVLIAGLQAADYCFDCDRILRELGEMGLAANAASALVTKLIQTDQWPQSGSARKYDITPEMRRRAREVLSKILPEPAASN